MRPLVISAAEPAEAEFATDRGRQRLPTWRLSAENALGPIWVLDPSVADWAPAAEEGEPRPSVLGGHIHRVPAVLRAPLGARVFVDLHGNPCQVIRAGVAAQPAQRAAPV